MSSKRFSAFLVWNVVVIFCSSVHILSAQTIPSSRQVSSIASTESHPRELMSLDQAIRIAKQQSLDAGRARHQFLSSYWQYRSYRAELLPSLNLNATLPNFNRSIVALQDAQTGAYNYIQNYSMRNNVALSIDQNITPTGGRISLISSLERIDQFSPSREVDYNAQALSLSYTQPLGGFNRFKWDKKSEPALYRQAKQEYLERIEAISINTVTLFFDLLIAQQELHRSQMNYDNTDTLYRIAQRRFAIGGIKKSELLQLELRLLNEGMAINSSQLKVDMANFQLRAFLGLSSSDPDFKLLPPSFNPALEVNFDEIYSRSAQNSSFATRMEIMRLNAQRDVAEAKADKGIKADLFAQFGLNQNGEDFSSTYSRLKDYELVSVGVRMPILDWGMGRGRVRMAQSKEEVTLSEIEQEQVSRTQDIIVKVMQFNNQGRQCNLSARADTIAQQSYQLISNQFALGTLSVLELNTAQSENSSANARYIAELRNFWLYYYELRQIALYDFDSGLNIMVDFDKIIEQR